MNDGFSWWLIVLGIAIGVALAWLFTVRLPRSDRDISEDEVTDEANWISRTIEADGGVAPQPLVEEVLLLHRHYLATPGIAGGITEPEPEPSVEPAVPPVDGHGTQGQTREVDVTQAGGAHRVGDLLG